MDNGEGFLYSHKTSISHFPDMLLPALSKLKAWAREPRGAALDAAHQKEL